jgi:pyrimidine deaminase RibD-like protein
VVVAPDGRTVIGVAHHRRAGDDHAAGVAMLDALAG